VRDRDGAARDRTAVEGADMPLQRSVRQLRGGAAGCEEGEADEDERDEPDVHVVRTGTRAPRAA
jgi:hypothetical protein